MMKRKCWARLGSSSSLFLPVQDSEVTHIYHVREYEYRVDARRGHPPGCDTRAGTVRGVVGHEAQHPDNIYRTIQEDNTDSHWARRLD